MKKFIIIILFLSGFIKLDSQCPVIACPAALTLTNCTALGQNITASSNYTANIISRWIGPGNIPIASIGTSTSTALLNSVGAYTVTFKDVVSGCSSSSIVSVNSTFTNAPSFNIVANTFSPACQTSVAIVNIVNANSSPPGLPVTYTAICPSCSSVLPSGNLGFISSYTINNCGAWTFVTKDNIGGCITSYDVAISCYTPGGIPTLTCTASNTNICQGNSVNLSVSGASTYTWSNGINGSSLSISPATNTCLQVIGTSSAGCTGSTNVCINVLNNPSLTINGITQICTGASTNYTASGANSYTWSNGTTGSVLNFTPSGNNCYTVMGLSANGCSASASQCFTTLTAPSLTVSGNTTVCAGSSTSLTVAGANNYTWSFNGSNASSISVMPLNGQVISGLVTGQNSNGCSQAVNFTITPLNTCAMVWPGDANRDGVVSNIDVLEIGLAANATGPNRSVSGSAWTAQFANAWAGTVSSGWNKAHADCNGDGTVNLLDVGAILSNFSFTHAFKPSAVNTIPDIKIVSTNSLVYEGIWNKVDIQLGDAANPIASLYGLAFDLNYDQNIIQNDSVKINYVNSMLNVNNQNIDFQKTMPVNGIEYGATVRSDHNNVSAYGNIAEFWFKLKSGLPSNSLLNLSLANVLKTNASGQFSTLSADAGIVLNVSNNLSGIYQKNGIQNFVQLYPNPASEQVIFKTSLSENIKYRMFDLTGREILNGDFKSSCTLAIGEIMAGTYLLKFESNTGQWQQRLIILHQ